MSARAAFAVLLVSIASMVAVTAWAKVPGAVHCYRKVCHRVKTLAETEKLVGRTLTLTASYYDDPKVDRFNVGLLTSSGERFDAGNAARAASSVFPDGTELLVWYPRTGRAAHVRINDLGPFHSDRTLDITRALAEQLGLVRSGVAKLKVTVIAPPPPEEPRYRAFRTYPETKGYLGRYSEQEMDTLGSDLVREARTLNPPLPVRSPRFAAAAMPIPKPWRRPVPGTLPSAHIALQDGAPSETLVAVNAPPLERLASVAPDIVAAADIPASAIPTPDVASLIARDDAGLARLRFAAVILSAPMPAAATVEQSGADRGISRGPATALSYILAGSMLGVVSLLIALVTRPMRQPVPVTIVANVPEAAATVEATQTPQTDPSVTVIGAALELVGDVISNGDVILEGRLFGNCHCRRLHVGATGYICGDVIAEELVVEGTVVGDILAHSVRADGAAALDGVVRYSELAVAAQTQVNALCRLRPKGPLSMAVKEAA